MRSAALVVGVALWVCAQAAEADELGDLRGVVTEQGQLIDELRGELDELRAVQTQEGEEVPAVAASPASDTDSLPASADGEVTPEYVDERIEEFETAPQSRFLISGYGDAHYRAVEDGPDGFGFGFNPGFHFRMSDRLHFNGELELGLQRDGHETETEVDLEFAQIDYLLTDWMTLSGGFFLTPFNAFGQRLHPSWINKLPSPPPIYGGHGEVGIIPVVSQVGAIVSGGATLWSDSSKFNYAVYVVNAPTIEEEDDEDVPLDFDFKSTPNSSSDVGYGARVGFLPIPNLEVGASYQTGKVAGSGDRYNLVGADLWYDFKGVEWRAEYVRLSQEFEDSSPSTQGYYVQASYRLDNLILDSGEWWGQVGRVEPVVRWGQITDYAPNERRQLALGLNFWVYESAPLKLSYELNSGKGGEDRFFLQFSYGF